MNGRQIENLLQMIDWSIDGTRQEATAYILNHRDAIVDELTKTGKAIIPTSAGDLSISRADIEAEAA